MSRAKLDKKTMKIKKNDFKKDFFENKAWSNNGIVFGVDEVGRGCLAGPILTATAALLSKNMPDIIVDSKTLSRPELIKAYKWLENNSIFSIGIVNSHNIDKLNIWNATILAMKKSTIGLFYKIKKTPESILVDSVPLIINDPALKDVPISSFDKGESLSSSIAAASIIAKVTRDKIIEKYDKIFPGYDFGEHKGYGTEKHIKAIESHGRTIIHRDSFLNKIDPIEKENEINDQQTLFL